MSYEEFKNEYTKLFKTMMSYTPDQVGSVIYAEEMEQLAAQYPDFAEACENE